MYNFFILFRFLHAPHDGGLAVIGALEDAGEDAGHASVLWLLQSSHHPLLHHADKLLVAKLSVPVSVKQSEHLALDSGFTITLACRAIYKTRLAVDRVKPLEDLGIPSGPLTGTQPFKSWGYTQNSLSPVPKMGFGFNLFGI